MLKTLGLSGFILLAALTSGCSLDSSLTGLNPLELLPFAKTQGSEIVSGSAQYIPATNGYRVSVSAGSMYDKITVKTSNKYVVYLTVQGQMLSEEPSP